MTLTDFRDIIDGLSASHITVLHDGIVIIAGIREFQDIGRDIRPAMGILSIPLRQCHRIADMMRTAIITGQHEVRTFVVVADIRE